MNRGLGYTARHAKRKGTGRADVDRRLGRLTIAKAIVGLRTGSLAILSEAGHSLIDFGATVMTYVAVRISGKPADKEHHYGHGKVESVSALAETALLFLLSGMVIWEAIKRLIGARGSRRRGDCLGLRRHHRLDRRRFFPRARSVARRPRDASQALEADALHFSSDLWSSLAVLCGLVGVHFGYGWADSAAALVVAVLVCIAGWRLGRRTVDTLTDTAPPGAAEKSPLDRPPGCRGSCASTGCAPAPSARRCSSTLTVAVSRTLPIDRVERHQGDAWPPLCAARFPVPSRSSDASGRARQRDRTRRVMVIARNRALAVHHVTVHELQDKRCDFARSGGRWPPDLARRARHGRRAGICDRGRARLRRRGRDPYRAAADGGCARPRGAARARACGRQVLGELAAEGHVIRDVHDVRVRETRTARS